MIERPWAFWRRVQYAVGFFVALTFIGVSLYFMYFRTGPTCFDGLQNADERGVDCGGTCERICETDIIMPLSLWAKSFEITQGQYNAVAYIENRNREIGSPRLKYTFKLFDAQGLIVEREGETVLPPDSVYPVFEGRIMTGDRIPTRTTIEFDNDITWLPGTVGREQFVLERRDLANADSKPRLTAELRNASLDEARGVEVIATIFDAGGNALTASRSFVEYFPGRTTQSVVFTWPEPIAKTLRSCEIPTDVVLGIDLSGSMNNDGDNPPEPITSVLMAAKSFVEGVQDHDQVGVVTYATVASLTETLVNDSQKVADVVSLLEIDPREERGSTNIGDALKKMYEELNSVRHNADARKIGILLTDGLATAPDEDPEAYARSEAEAFKATGAELFTIGLGNEVNEVFLQALASKESTYYKAPTVRELTTIYDSITKSICEDGAAVIEIIPKAITTFE